MFVENIVTRSVYVKSLPNVCMCLMSIICAEELKSCLWSDKQSLAYAVRKYGMFQTSACRHTYLQACITHTYKYVYIYINIYTPIYSLTLYHTHAHTVRPRHPRTACYEFTVELLCTRYAVWVLSQVLAYELAEHVEDRMLHINDLGGHAVRLVACTREDTFQSCHTAFGGKPHQQSRPSCTSAASSAEHVLEPFATFTHIFEPFSAWPMHSHAGVWLSACAVPTPGHLGTVVNWSSSNETVSSILIHARDSGGKFACVTCKRRESATRHVGRRFRNL